MQASQITPETKKLRIVGEHKIRDVWEDDLALKIHALLDAKQVDWTSTDVVRIATIDKWKELRNNVVLWIGVVPESLSYERGIDVALRCKRVLVDDFGIEDVDVEIRTSRVVKAADARPRLCELASCCQDNEKRLGVIETLAYTLGIPICGRDTQGVEGTAGFFLDEKGEGDGGRLLLVTARHVVLPDLDDNEGSERKGGGKRGSRATFWCSTTRHSRNTLQLLRKRFGWERCASITRKGVLRVL